MVQQASVETADLRDQFFHGPYIRGTHVAPAVHAAAVLLTKGTERRVHDDAILPYHVRPGSAAVKSCLYQPFFVHLCTPSFSFVHPYTVQLEG